MIAINLSIKVIVSLEKATINSKALQMRFCTKIITQNSSNANLNNGNSVHTQKFPKCTQERERENVQTAAVATVAVAVAEVAVAAASAIVAKHHDKSTSFMRTCLTIPIYLFFYYIKVFVISLSTESCKRSILRVYRILTKYAWCRMSAVKVIQQKYYAPDYAYDGAHRDTPNPKTTQIYVTLTFLQ
uniref:Uncharacterized protein n=1 Tax=Glossina austeni TaxID=7395 RepID=A0A1A9V9T4_GLOAU